MMTRVRKTTRRSVRCTNYLNVRLKNLTPVSAPKESSSGQTGLPWEAATAAATARVGVRLFSVPFVFFTVEFQESSSLTEAVFVLHTVQVREKKTGPLVAPTGRSGNKGSN